MFEILAKFFKFSGKENENKFKLSIVIGLAEALASAMKIPAIMYVLIGLMSKEAMGKYIIWFNFYYGNCRYSRYYLQEIFNSAPDRRRV